VLHGPDWRQHPKEKARRPDQCTLSEAGRKVGMGVVDKAGVLGGGNRYYRVLESE